MNSLKILDLIRDLKYYCSEWGIKKYRRSAESPAIDIFNLLLNLGYNVKWHDPLVDKKDPPGSYKEN